MTSLALAALVFIAMHLLIAGTRLRDALVLRLGERSYRGLFSLASAAVLGWLIWAYVRARAPQLTPLLELRWLAGALLSVAFLLIVLGVTTPGPTIVGGEKLLDRDDPARGIHRVTRHPFLWGIALWGAVHIVYNPGLAHLVFFGTFVAVGIAGTFSIDAKRLRRFGEKWQRYAAVTSNVPFAAVATGRNRIVWSEFGALRPAAAVVAFVLVAVLHARFFGVPAL
jgi:uncharacterized membrane protein